MILNREANSFLEIDFSFFFVDRKNKLTAAVAGHDVIALLRNNSPFSHSRETERAAFWRDVADFDGGIVEHTLNARLRNIRLKTI